MKIRITTDEKKVSVDGYVLDMPELDWNHECFMGAPDKKWDDVAAVQFDLARGMGHIEMITVETDDPDQANFRAADRPLNQEKFDRLFGWVLPLHAARKVEIEAEREATLAREAAEREANDAKAQAAEQARIEEHNAALLSGTQPAVDPATFPGGWTPESDAATQAIVADMQAKLAAMEAEQAALKAKVAVFEDAAKDVPGGAV